MRDDSSRKASAVLAAYREENVMLRRVSSLLVIAAVLLLGLTVLPRSGAIVRAQEASPAAGEMAPEGVTFEPLGFAQGVTLPASADLLAARFTIDPGAVFPLDPEDPSGGLLLVQSGTITVKVDTEVVVVRGAAMQQAMATPEGSGDMAGMMETFAAGEEMTLSAGDSAYIPGNVTGEFRNDGSEQVDALAFLVGPAGMLSNGE
jgi:mannose-6-phosphate isomerase-like protein (cupin superfamily)